MKETSPSLREKETGREAVQEGGLAPAEGVAATPWFACGWKFTAFVNNNFNPCCISIAQPGRTQAVLACLADLSHTVTLRDRRFSVAPFYR